MTSDHRIVDTSNHFITTTLTRRSLQLRCHPLISLETFCSTYPLSVWLKKTHQMQAQFRMKLQLSIAQRLGDRFEKFEGLILFGVI